MTGRWFRHRRLRQRVRHHTPDAGGALRFMLVAVVATALSLILGTGTIFAGAAGVYAYFSMGLPNPEYVETRDTLSSTFIYDRNGRLLYEVFDPRFGRRQYVRLPAISPYVIQATIATEDHDFYENSGVNVRGIARALVSNLVSGDDDAVQGGSSITQQLVKNVFIPEEERTQRLPSRKIKEVILAYALTQRYSKDQILEWYLNENNYGNLSYGIESAAQSYFGKSAQDLNLAEAAMLAGLPQAPALYSPLLNPERAKARQRDVLSLMARQGYITQEEADAATNQELHYQSGRFTIEAPHFVMYVRDLLEQKYGRRALYRRGLRVTTSLDLDVQNTAQQIVSTHIAENGQRFNANNASLVALDPNTGEILAMVGSVDYFNADIQGQVNMTIADRQPGSTFKPITYLTTFLKGWAPATVVQDTPLTYVDDLGRAWSPENTDKTFSGPVPIRTALATSMNIPAVRAILYAGVDNVLDMAHRMGITTLTRKNWYGPSLTLGGGEVRLVDLAYAYTVLANNGVMRGQPVAPDARQPGFRELEPVALLKVEDQEGNILEEFQQPLEVEIVQAPYAYLVTHILSDNAARARFFGANNLLHLRDRPVAAKTGTTEDNRDNYTVGYTPDVVAAVWVGNTDNREMSSFAFGSSNAAPIWNSFMVKFHEGKPVKQFARPPGLVDVQVCADSGLLVSDTCANPRREIFVPASVPKERHRGQGVQVVKIDRRTGQPATPETPPEFIVERVITAAPGQAGDAPPQAEVAPDLVNQVLITSPASGATVSGVLTIMGSASGSRFYTGYSLEYGEGTNPATWNSIISTSRAVDNGTLGTLDTNGLSGVYTIRLTVLDKERGNQTFRVVVNVGQGAPIAGAVFPEAVPLASPTPEIIRVGGGPTRPPATRP